MLRCNFRGEEVDTIQRVALDVGYDRLTVRHDKKYACPECSTKKEKERQEPDKSRDD